MIKQRLLFPIDRQIFALDKEEAARPSYSCCPTFQIFAVGHMKMKYKALILCSIIVIFLYFICVERIEPGLRNAIEQECSQVL